MKYLFLGLYLEEKNPRVSILGAKKGEGGGTQLGMAMGRVISG